MGNKRQEAGGVKLSFWMATKGLSEIFGYYECDAPGMSKADLRLRTLFPDSKVTIKTDTATRRSFLGREYDFVDISFPDTEPGVFAKAAAYFKLMTMPHVMPCIPETRVHQGETCQFQWTGCSLNDLRKNGYTCQV